MFMDLDCMIDIFLYVTKMWNESSAKRLLAFKLKGNSIDCDP